MKQLSLFPDVIQDEELITINRKEVDLVVSEILKNLHDQEKTAYHNIMYKLDISDDYYNLILKSIEKDSL